MIIKSYKVFESKLNQVEDVKDICIELEHDGFIINVNKIYGVYEVRIEKLSDEVDEDLEEFIPKYFKYSEVEDVINRLKEYLGEKLNEMTIYTDHEDFTWVQKEFTSVILPDFIDIYLIIIEFEI